MRSHNLIRICAAGAGKTYSICKEAVNNKDRRCTLIVTYTNKGLDAIIMELRKGNNGIIPSKVKIMTWYSFLLNELIKPYQTELFGINFLKSIDFSQMYGNINYRKGKNRYINSCGDVVANEASKLAIELNAISQDGAFRRLEKIYSHIFFDEIQDMVGNDQELIGKLITETSMDVTVVGDEKQSTFTTHNTRKNKGTSGVNIWEYFREFERSGNAKVECNLVSRRFNSEICDFANYIYPSENSISTNMKEVTKHDGVFIILNSDIEVYFNYFKPTVLKYDARTNTHGFLSYNFGECKGMTFDRVMIFPNGPLKDYITKGKPLGSPEKYYVGVTRPKYSIAIILNSLPQGDNQEQIKIDCGRKKISAIHIIPKKEEY